MLNRIAYLLCFLCGVQGLFAQAFEEYKRDAEEEYQTWKSEAEQEFKEYRDRINAEFAEFMRQSWPEYKAKPAMAVPDSPLPPLPVVKAPDVLPSSDPVRFNRVTMAPVSIAPPQPVVPLPKIVIRDKGVFSFYFYGEKCYIPIENKHRFALSSVNENGVADGWNVLSHDDYLPVVAKCLDYRDKLRLCDWGYVRFVEQMTTAFFSKGQLNEARLMQMYILTQSGYKVRIARADNKLVLLLPSEDSIYEYAYLTIDGCNYYVVDSSLEETSFNVLKREFPKEQFFSLRIREQPALSINPVDVRHIQSAHNAGLSADINVNQNLIDFYDDYPLSSNWDIYANASLSDDVKKQLYPVLRGVIAGKSSVDAANVLLHFVQTAFEYATDREQFGSERPLFADETLYYPYSDCEDRAILYSILVRDLLGLDVVLLNYPGHLATAVCFEGDMAGDYLNMDGYRYVVCDPTYINADVGQAMPQFKQVAAEVIKVK